MAESGVVKCEFYEDTPKDLEGCVRLSDACSTLVPHIINYCSENYENCQFRQRYIKKTIERINNSYVLFVDDEEGPRTLAEISLGKKFNIKTAEDGKQGLEMAIAERPSLVVTDINMPIMGGFEFAERLQEHYGDNTPPIIILTGYSNDDTLKKVADKGYALLVKPFDNKKLIDTIIYLAIKNQ